MRKGKSLGLKEARFVVQEAIKHASKTEGRPMSVAVVDRHGHPLYLERMDGASGVTARMCLTKCCTAIEVLRDTIEQREILEKFGLKWDEFSSTEYTVIPSGCLIKTKDGTIVGAIGSSGRNPWGPGGDEDVSRAGVKAFEQSEWYDQ